MVRYWFRVRIPGEGTPILTGAGVLVVPFRG